MSQFDTQMYRVTWIGFGIVSGGLYYYPSVTFIASCDADAIQAVAKMSQVISVSHAVKIERYRGSVACDLVHTQNYCAPNEVW